MWIGLSRYGQIDILVSIYIWTETSGFGSLRIVNSYPDLDRCFVSDLMLLCVLFRCSRDEPIERAELLGLTKKHAPELSMIVHTPPATLTAFPYELDFCHR